jgi:hypothetical protein
MGFRQMTLKVSLERRNFLITSVSTFLTILIFPVLTLIGRTERSRAFSSRESDRLLDIVQKYGVEFGGEDTFRRIKTSKGGQNVSI